MVTTVVGLFDQASEAQRAAHELCAGTFAQRDVLVSSDAIDAVTLDCFARGELPAHDVQFYTEAVRHGGQLVVVQTTTDQAAQAAVILGRYQVVDIDARTAELNHTGMALMVSTLGTDGAAIAATQAPPAPGDQARQRGGVRIHATRLAAPVAAPPTAAPLAPPRDSAIEAGFQSHYMDTNAASGVGYEHYQTAYRYGYQLGIDPRYPKREWKKHKQMARTTWENYQPGTWEQFKDAIRYAWNTARGSR